MQPTRSSFTVYVPRSAPPTWGQKGFPTHIADCVDAFDAGVLELIHYDVTLVISLNPLKMQKEAPSSLTEQAPGSQVTAARDAGCEGRHAADKCTAHWVSHSLGCLIADSVSGFRPGCSALGSSRWQHAWQAWRKFWASALAILGIRGRNRCLGGHCLSVRVCASLSLSAFHVE